MPNPKPTTINPKDSRYERGNFRGAGHTLSKEHGIPVTIHDRSWITKEVIENDRKDLAYNYLGVGEVRNDPLALGPKDYSRTRQLAEIEKSLADSSAYDGMESQRVSEALIAAKLSRSLQKPRTQTDGLFDRAIRLAKANGTFHQRLETRYEQIWTAFWWYDDFDFLVEQYDNFEKEALNSTHAADIQLLCNLFQLLINCVVHQHLTRKASDIDARGERLKAALEPISQTRDRPNNALEAESLLIGLNLSFMLVEGDRSKLDEIWQAYRAIIAKAEGLGEFDANRLEKMIEVAGSIAGNSSEYTALVETLAEFIAKRRSEGEGAVILLKRAQKLDFDRRMDMIRILGKAIVGLSKREYQTQLIEATQLMALAYRSADLFWAARASCIAALASIIIDGEADREIPAIIVPTLKVWGWVSLSLGHLPDFLAAIQLINGALGTLPFSDESKAKISEDLMHFDVALGCLFLNADRGALDDLTDLPDVLEALDLEAARSALLFANGCIATMREDGTIPASESDEKASELMSEIASQPIARGLPGQLITNWGGEECYSTTIIGMELRLTHDGSDQAILLSEVILASIEAFFGTTLEHRVSPHTQLISVSLEIHDIPEPSVVADELDMRLNIRWPRAVRFPSFDDRDVFHRFVNECAARTFALGFVAADMTRLLEELFANDAVQQRISMISTAPNSYHRFHGRSLSRLSDWQRPGMRDYPVVEPKPTIKTTIREGGEVSLDQESGEGNPGDLVVRAHKDIEVRSLIDVHAWDRAKWKGVGFGAAGAQYPPMMFLLFEDRDAAMKIFERWQKKVGRRDAEDEIFIAIIKNLPNQNQHYYSMMITGKMPEAAARSPEKFYSYAVRSMTMTPNSSINLDRFMADYSKTNCYFLAPAIVNGTDQPEVLVEFAILKRNLVVKNAADVGEHDIEHMGIRMHE